ncbi:metal/formaldehyde-sensitive transcriptional repressor [Kordiimonas pumila]|uniref:Metal/formaldehyde-sensitive transcriptional repressor n=1 Tax=Kordiimonas pumila TaxID=2161677 RepID=A0ABV7D288_9PROT|nr:metal/formaldehyde-sensitive transcriptional repressor [Kordiimonas pumila]
MSHVMKSQKKLLTRIRRIKGQASALESALETNTDCIAVLQQVAAIRGAVTGLMAELMEEHMREHLGADNVSPEQRKEDMDQVITVIRSYLK